MFLQQNKDLIKLFFAPEQTVKQISVSNYGNDRRRKDRAVVGSVADDGELL